MPELSITLSEELRTGAATRAAEGGHPTVEAYIASLIRRDLEATPALPSPPPEHLTVRTRQELDSKIIEGLRSPASPMTDDDWAELHRRVAVRAR